MRKGERKRGSSLFKEIIAENVPNLEWDLDIKVDETRSFQKISTQKDLLRYTL